MRDALAEMTEAFSTKQIKMAIGIASDKRYAGGNMTGAVKQIEKIKRGLSDHPQVAAVLKRQNEMNEQQPNCGCGKTPCETYGSIDEGRMKELHGYIDKGMSAEEIAKKMKLDLKTIKALMKEEVEQEKCDCCEETPCLCEDDCECKSLDENRAARDAKRAMSKDKDMQQKPFDKDDKASMIDTMKAKKNIVVQLKKATNLGGSKPIEFDSGPSKKIDPKFAKAALDKLNKIKKSDDRLKFQAKLSKSYKDMLQALKEDFELVERKFEAGKSASGYDIFHKDFSSAMQHATAFAKKKGQPIKKDEIDNKVATGPRKPSAGKENSYTLETEKGKMWSVQVYNMGSKFELNMYLTSSHVPEGEELDEMKMNDPKLNKIFDKLKKGSKVKLKTSSTISQGKDYVEYIVKSKNTVNKGRVEKITLATVGNEKAVKKFLYKRDGQVTFAIGDMGASIDDIKESTNEVPENMAAYFAAITKQLGER